MNPRSLAAIRRLVIFISLCLMLGTASVTFAQAPFKECPDAPKGFQTIGGTSEKGYMTAAHLECNGTAIFADDLKWDADTIFAQGNVLVTQKDLRISAERMEMDKRTKLAVFFQAIGTATLSETAPDKNLFGSFEPQVWFRAERLERIGPRAYKLTNGTFSTCTQPNARWEMRSTSGTVILDDHATMKNVQFRVKGIPVLYIPYLYYPMKKEDRSTGFLIPNYSKSALNGHGFSNAFFWAMSRSMDATFFHDYFSKTGQGAGAEYRYVASNTSRGNFKFYGLDEKLRLDADGNVERPAHVSYKFEGSLNQRLGSHFTLFGSTDYTTDITSSQLYQQDVYDFTNRNRHLNFTLQGQGFRGAFGRRLNLTANVSQIDSFTDTTNTTNTTSQGRSATPQVTLRVTSSRIPKTVISYGGSAEVGRFELRDSNKPTLTVRRMDATGTLDAPLSKFQWLTVNTTARGRLTEWLDTLDPLTGLQTSAPLTRSLLDASVSVVGPRVSKVFLTPKNRFADGFKHLIEPSVSVGWLSPFDRRNEVIQYDPTDTLVGGTTRMDYGLVNRVLMRPHSADGNGQSRDFLTVEVRQTYYSEAQAGAVDPLYSNASAGKFTPVLIRGQLTPGGGVAVQFSMSKNSVAWAQPGALATDVAYNVYGSLNKEHLNLSGGWSKTDYFTKAQGFIDIPTSHSIYANTSVKSHGVGLTYGFNLDVPTGTLIQQRIVAFYHAQCCGIAVDYQERRGLQLSTVPIDRRFAVTFTLAGIGSFSPPLGAFR